MISNLLRDHPLDREFDYLREKLADLGAPPQIDAALQKAFRKQHSHSGRATRFGMAGQWLAPGVAIVVSVAMCTWLMLSPFFATLPLLDRSTDGSATAFIALQTLEQIALEPNPRLIETQIPHMLLSTMGVVISPDRADESLRAEVLVSAAGQPLALRFLAGSNLK